MQHDPVIWNLISKGFCSFKTKIAVGGRTKRKASGFLSKRVQIHGSLIWKQNCPLANSRYATIREEKRCVLFVHEDD